MQGEKRLRRTETVLGEIVILQNLETIEIVL